MKSETNENYLKEIYQLGLDHGQVTTSMLAERFGFAAATVTGQLKKLARMKWVEYSPYRGVSLTDSGRLIALEVIRHHRLIETYLSRALGVPWDRVHLEAEKLEHAISEYLESRIDEYLDFPKSDPHGSPIPGRDGEIPDRDRIRLSEIPEGASGRVVEVYDRDSQLLARFEELGLLPGVGFVVTGVEPVDGLLTLLIRAAPDGGQSSPASPVPRTVTVGRTTASNIFVFCERMPS